MSVTQSFGPYVHQLRGSKGLTLRAFALSTGLDPSRISLLERHATVESPHNYEVKAIAYALELLEAPLLQRLAQDYAPDMAAVEDEKDPFKHAIFCCRAE